MSSPDGNTPCLRDSSIAERFALCGLNPHLSEIFSQIASNKEISKSLEKVLSYCLVFKIPVPMLALETVCESIPNYRERLIEAVTLGLIESVSQLEQSEEVYKVNSKLSQLIDHLDLKLSLMSSRIKLPQPPELYNLYRKGFNKLNELWGNEENKSGKKWSEIFRLLLADKENPSRFNQGFLFVTNPRIKSTFFYKLKEVKWDLSYSNICTPHDIYLRQQKRCSHLCTQLDIYLRQQQWREADRETTWIFYQIMVVKEFKTWSDLLEGFPSDTLNEIDELWFKSSNGHFGFSVQKQIFESLDMKLYSPENRKQFSQVVEGWKQFGRAVGWCFENEIEGEKVWKKINDLSFTFEESRKGNLPASWTAEDALWGSNNIGEVPNSMDENKRRFSDPALLISRSDLLPKSTLS